MWKCSKKKGYEIKHTSVYAYCTCLTIKLPDNQNVAGQKITMQWHNHHYCTWERGANMKVASINGL